MFKGKSFHGFSAENAAQRSQIRIHFYESKDNFLISLKIKSASDQIYLLKTDEKLTAEDAREIVH